MKISVLQIIFLIMLFMVLFKPKSMFNLDSFFSLLNSFFKNMKKHNSISK